MFEKQKHSIIKRINKRFTAKSSRLLLELGAKKDVCIKYPWQKFSSEGVKIVQENGRFYSERWGIIIVRNMNNEK